MEVLRREKAQELAAELKRACKKTAKQLNDLEYLIEYENDKEAALTAVRISEGLSKQFKRAGELEWLYENNVNVFEEVFLPGKTCRKEYSFSGNEEEGYKIFCPVLPVQKYAHKGASKEIAKNVEYLLQENFRERNIAAPVYRCLCDVDIVIHMNEERGLTFDAHNMEFKYVLDSMIGFMFPDDNSSFVRVRLSGDTVKGISCTEITIKKAEK